MATFPQLDSNTTIEAGLRFRSRQDNWRELKPLMLALAETGEIDVSKVSWARSESHPSKPHFWAIGGDLGADGYVGIPKSIQEAFDPHEGFLMAKVVTLHTLDHFAVPARFKDTELYGYDKSLKDKNGNRDNDGRRDGGEGDWVYSLPIHNLKLGGKPHFFFVIRVTHASEGYVNIEIDMVSFVRGKEHFRVLCEDYVMRNAVSVNALPVDHPDLADLPIRLAVEEFLRNRKEFLAVASPAPAA